MPEPTAEGTGQRLQHHEPTGRPLGDESFLMKLQGLLNRVPSRRKARRKPKRQAK